MSSAGGRRRRAHAWHLLPAVAVVLIAGAIRRVVLPNRPEHQRASSAGLRPEPAAQASLDGAGVRIVVNPASGPAWVEAPTAQLRNGLPAADIRELAEGDDLAALLRDPGCTTIGVAGGDGTVAAAAAIAVERGIPLVVVPGGTLNHLARDLGVDDVDDAIEAVRGGVGACMDVGTIGEQGFVNTLTLGGYTAVVDTRERLERLVGKWPALVLALVWELPRMQPVRLELDGRRVDVWLGWIGNGTYGPPGLGPAWRDRLDDGVLDVRLVHGGPRYARTRFVVAALVGRLSALSVYSEELVDALEVTSLDGPLRLAADGETFDGPASFTVGKQRGALRVLLPPPAR